MERLTTMNSWVFWRRGVSRGSATYVAASFCEQTSSHALSPHSALLIGRRARICIQ